MSDWNMEIFRKNGIYQARVCRYTGNEKNVIIPKEYNNTTVTEISPSAFADTDIESVIVSNKVSKICEKAFNNCKNLKSVTIKSDRIDIEDFAFADCKALTSINLKKKSDVCFFKNIFAGSAIEEITLSEKTIFGKDTFAKADKLINIKCPKSFKSPVYDIDGVLISKISNAVLVYPPGKKDITYIIPDGANALNKDDFSLNTNLQVLHAENVQCIYGGPGRIAKNIRKIYLSDKLQKIYVGADAFKDVTIVFSGNPAVINEWADKTNFLKEKIRFKENSKLRAFLDATSDYIEECK